MNKLLEKLNNEIALLKRTLKEQKEAKKYLQWHSDLGFYFASITSMDDALGQLLEYILKVKEIQAAGIYLINPDTGNLELKISSGLSPGFIETSKEYNPESENFKIVSKGIPLYKEYSELIKNSDKFQKENLKYIGVIPIKYSNNIIGSINIGSQIPLQNNLLAKTYLETISAQTGAALWRIDTQHNLLLSRSNFKLMFDSIDDFIFIVNKIGEVIEFNPCLEKRLGYSAAELRGLPYFKLFPVENRDELLLLREKISNDEQTICCIPFITKSGEKIQMETRVTLGKWNDKDVIYAISRDITDRLETLEKLRSSEACWRFALDSLSNGVWEADLKTRKISYSKECLKLSGYSPDEVNGTYEEWISLIHHEDANTVIQNMGAHIKGEIPVFNVEYRILCKNGNYRWVYDKGIVISRDKNGNPQKMIGMFIDISLQKKLQESLLKSLQKETELNRLKSQFVSMASHEFKTPLSIMLMAVESLLSYRDKMTDEEVSKKIKRIQNKIQFLMSVTEKTLDLSRIESGKMEVNLIDTDLNKFLFTTVEGVRLSSDNSHKIKYIDSANAVRLKIDQQMIKEVINNLLYNSFKYSAPGTEITVQLSENEQNSEIQITDQGIGIPESDQPNIFEAFHRGSNVIGIRGTGLGLSIAKKIIELHKGSITFKSEVNKGTTFFIRLPIVES